MVMRCGNWSLPSPHRSMDAASRRVAFMLVYAAVIFAVLGLRSLYFVLAALTRYLVHLETAVVVLLFFIAFKLALQSANHIFDWPGLHIGPTLSLVIILGVLAMGVVASFLFPAKPEQSDNPSL